MELFKKIKEEYAKIDGNYLTKFSANPKQLHIFGWLYTEMNISGVSFLPTGEANYNQYIPNIDLPFVVAHELAHTKGVMGEDEANDLAMYVCLNSDDPYLKYSALANAYNSIEPMAQTINDDETTDRAALFREHVVHKANDSHCRLDLAPDQKNIGALFASDTNKSMSVTYKRRLTDKNIAETVINLKMVRF